MVCIINTIYVLSQRVCDTMFTTYKVKTYNFNVRITIKIINFFSKKHYKCELIIDIFSIGVRLKFISL